MRGVYGSGNRCLGGRGGYVSLIFLRERMPGVSYMMSRVLPHSAVYCSNVIPLTWRRGERGVVRLNAGGDICFVRKHSRNEDICACVASCADTATFAYSVEVTKLLPAEGTLHGIR